MYTKKGLSDMITTVIMLVLALVIIAIVWAVVTNMIGTKADEAKITEKCISNIVKATSVKCDGSLATSVCNVTFSRDTGIQNEEITGMKLVFKDANGIASASPVDVPGNLQKLATKTTTNLTVGVANATAVQVSVYFKSADGKEVICSNPTEFKGNFTA